MITLDHEVAADAAAIDALIELCFGPGRFAKTAYRLREGVPAVHALSYVARTGGALCGSLRFWPIDMAGRKALLLGPLAVDPALRGRGAGVGLMIVGLSHAARLGHRAVMLVGDEPYYARVGFRRAEPGRFVLPGPVDPARVLIRELEPGALDGAAGPVCRQPTG